MWREHDVLPDASKILQQSCASIRPPFRCKRASITRPDYKVLFMWWKPGFKNGSSRANGHLPWNVLYSRTLAVMFNTSHPYLHASALGGPVDVSLASSNRRGASRLEAITSSSAIAISRSTTPLCFGEHTGICSLRSGCHDGPVAPRTPP